MSFRLVPKWVTLNGVMAPILRYFTEFGSFRCALRKSGWRCRRTKSSRSLSHLLMSFLYCLETMLLHASVLHWYTCKVIFRQLPHVYRQCCFYSLRYARIRWKLSVQASGIARWLPATVRPLCHHYVACSTTWSSPSLLVISAMISGYQSNVNVMACLHGAIVAAIGRATRGFPNVQFYTKCAVLIPICAVLTTYLCSSDSSHYLI